MPEQTEGSRGSRDAGWWMVDVWLSLDGEIARSEAASVAALVAAELPNRAGVVACGCRGPSVRVRYAVEAVHEPDPRVPANALADAILDRGVRATMIAPPTVRRYANSGGERGRRTVEDARKTFTEGNDGLLPEAAHGSGDDGDPVEQYASAVSDLEEIVEAESNFLEMDPEDVADQFRRKYCAARAKRWSRC